MLFTLLLIATPVPPPCPEVATFRGAPSSTGDVVIVEETGQAPQLRPPELQAIRLLPIEPNGRTRLQRFLPESARLQTDIPGASRIRLPQARGSVYHYERPEVGRSVFGFFVVAGDGTVRVLFERDGTGPALDADPFCPKVAVAPDGAALLIATRREAGGDLFEVDVTSATSLSRTSAVPPLSVVPSGLGLTATLGVAGTPRGVWRFDRQTAADATRVTFEDSPPWYAGDVVTSRNGAFAATIAGTEPANAHVYSFSGTGDARRVTQTGTRLSGAGFLPESQHGPYLAITDDGSRCAWRAEGVTSREAFVADVGGAIPAVIQVTSDVNYVDTLDETGQFLFLPTGLLVLAVGELDLETGAMENLDVYAVDPSGPSPSFTNLSGSSGVSVPPFSASDLTPADAFLLPVSGRLFVANERSGGTGELLSIQLSQPDVRVELDAVKALQAVAWTGTDTIVSVRRSLDPDPIELWRLPDAPSGATLLHSVPSIESFDRLTVRPDGTVAYVHATGGTEFVWRVDAATGNRDRLVERPLLYGPTLDFSSTGGLALTVGSFGASSVYVGWDAPSPPARLPIASASGFVLPGD